MVEKAKSGHPGLPMGAAPMAFTLFLKHLRFNPSEPKWIDRDRFVLAAGHGSALLYSILHLCGYDIPMEQLKAFRQLGSITPGHPEFHLTPGVEATTGPLGQGDANIVGMAIAERILAHRFNRDGFNIINHYTYALSSDGGLMEGVSAEAASLAGHLKLGKLIALYDSNDVSLDGPTSLAFSGEDVAKRYKSYGWQVLSVRDGNRNVDAIDKSIAEAKAETGKPSLIIIKTTIGYGSPNKAGKSVVHGSPLGHDETRLTKENLGWDPDAEFHIPVEVTDCFGKILKEKEKSYGEWKALYEKYNSRYPDLAEELERVMASRMPENLKLQYPIYKPGDQKATRHASHDTLNILSEKIPEIAIGAADVSASTLAKLDTEPIFNGQDGSGRNIYFGVREHAMAAIANGMSCHGGIIPVISTYFVFTDYLRPAIRLAAMNKLRIIYVTSHDSIATGEDGPTHQPVEQLMSLRAIPDLTVIRPADAHETIEAWRWIITNPPCPVMLVLTRQNLPVLDGNNPGSASGLHRGAYVLSDPAGGRIDAIIIATGSEVHLALSAKEKLAGESINIRVVSMPSWEIFNSQDKDYRTSVLPSGIRARISIEAGSTQGWEKWIGDSGIAVGIDRFGMSAPGDRLMQEYGINLNNVCKAVKSTLMI
jgi:transketolase